MPAFIIRPSPDFLKVHPELRHISHALALQYAFQEKVVIDKELENIGSRLWQAIGMKVGFNEARLQVGTAPLDIIIESDNPAIQQLPWETLHHPELGFLGRHENFTLSRRLSAAPTTAPLRKEPLRVLLFSALPDDLDAETGRLNSEEEQAQVLEAFLPWIQEGKVRLETPEDGQFATLQANLDEFKPHLVFLNGHGKFHHEPHTGEAPYGTFLFEGENGESVAIPDGQIAQVFAGTSVQCVVLSACESGKSASVELNNGLSYQLAAQGIPQVVGMRESIMDVAGIQFARAFCDGLLAAQGVGQALQAARMAITLPLKEEHQGNVRYKLYGQWCLPSLLSQDPASLLVDWDFIAEPLPDYTPHIRLENITLPQQFFGRRRELRELRRMIRDNASGHVLITGAGGMGKTALAGKLADSLRKQGYHVFAWSAANPETWVALSQQMVETLQYHNKEEFERESKQNQAPADYARLLLRLVMRQHDNRAVVFLDNLESVQDSETLAIQHTELQAWLDVAHSMGRDAPHCILTSRWKMPEWADDAHYQLITPLYGDFLQFAQRQNLPKDFLNRLHQLYSTFGGNFRLLECFIPAIQGMYSNEEQVLKYTEDKTYANMMITEMVSKLTGNENTLLHHLLAYQTAVPLEGIAAIWDANHGETLAVLQRLLDRSLVEQYINPHTKKLEYQLAALVRSWLLVNGTSEELSQALLKRAASFLLWQLEEDEITSQKNILITHVALLAAGFTKHAQRLVLDWLVEPLTRSGQHETLLQYLLPLTHAEDQMIRGEAFGVAGKQYLHLGNYDSAFSHLEMSLDIRRDMGDKDGVGTILNTLSAVAHAHGEYDLAECHLRESLAIRRETDDKVGEGSTLNNLAMVAYARGDYDLALCYLEQSLAIRQELNDKAGQGVNLDNLFQIYHARGEHKAALDCLKQALVIQKEISDQRGMAATLHNIAKIFDRYGNHEVALSYFKQSLAIRKRSKDEHGESIILNDISTIAYAQGRYDDALQQLENARRLQQKIGDKPSESTTLNNMATNAYAKGDYDSALEYLNQSLHIQEKINDKTKKGTTLLNMAQIFKVRGSYDVALDVFQQVLTIFREVGDKEKEGITLNNISQIYDAREDYGIALDYLTQALGVFRKIGDKAGEGAALNNISQIHDARGDYDAALNYLEQALMIQREIGDKAKEGTTLNNISQIHDARGDYQSALGYLQQARAVHQDIGNKLGMCITLLNIGYAHIRNNEIEEAVQAWGTSYLFAKDLSLAQALEALEKLAGKLGLPNGLDSWEQLVKQHPKT